MYKGDEFDNYYDDYDEIVNRNLVDLGNEQGTGGQQFNATDPPVQSQDTRYFNNSDPNYVQPPGPTPGPFTDAAPSPPPPSPPPPAPPPPRPQPGPAPSFGGQGPQTAANSIPPDLIGILNSLKDGITNFQVPQVNFQPQTTPAYADLVRNAIMDAIREGGQPVNATDPQIAPLLAAVQGQGQRAKEQNEGRLAEQLSAKHLLSSGAYDVGRERYNQGIDEATGGTLAQMMTQVLSQRQQRLMQAIQMGANFLTADQARQLQAELTNVNSALAQYQAKSSVGLGTLASLLQNQQFYDSLGANIGMFASNQNSNAGNFFP